MRRFIRDFKLEIEAFVLIVGLMLFAIGTLGIFAPSGGFLESFLRDVGAWKWWCFLIGILMIIGGGWYTIDNVRKRREFERLIKSESKAKFVKNKDRIEYLAWSLTSEHESRLWEKKKEFGIKN